MMYDAYHVSAKATGREVDHTLNSIYWLLTDSPSRREDFTNVAGKCCATWRRPMDGSSLNPSASPTEKSKSGLQTTFFQYTWQYFPALPNGSLHL